MADEERSLQWPVLRDAKASTLWRRLSSRVGVVLTSFGESRQSIKNETVCRGRLVNGGCP